MKHNWFKQGRILLLAAGMLGGMAMVAGSLHAEDRVQMCISKALITYLECAQEGATMVKQTNAAAKAVDIIGAWVDAGAPENGTFQYTAVDGNQYSAEFKTDILPLFTQDSVWFDGSRSCASCHFANSENAYHEMDVTTYAGLMRGGDVLSHPPGVPLFGESSIGGSDYDWKHSKLRARLRNNRMPPNWPEDLTETNRDGPCVTINGDSVHVQGSDGKKKHKFGCELNAVGLIGAWVGAGAPNGGSFAFGGVQLNFESSVLPLFTKPNMWFAGSAPCASCHFGNSEISYHEMDLSTYEGIMKGGDVLSEPPGVPLLGQSEVGATDYALQTPFPRNRTLYLAGSYYDPTLDIDEGGPMLVEALDSGDGKRRWIYRGIDGFVKSVYASETEVVYIGYQDFVNGIDARTGKRLWRRDTGNWVPALTGLGRYFYFGSATTVVHARRTLDGTAIWEYNIPWGSFNYLLGAPVLNEGRMVFLTQRGQVLSLNLATGEPLWYAETGLAARSGLVYDPPWLVIGDMHGGLHAYQIPLAYR